MQQWLIPTAAFALGALIQPLLALIERKLAQKRSLEIKKPQWFIELLLYVGNALMFFVAALSAATIGNLVFMLVTLSLCWIATSFDIKYRLLPNGIVLWILIAGTASCLLGWTSDSILRSLAGFGIAGVMFLLPCIFKKQVGAGDVKLAAVLGFCAGLTGSLIVILLMGVLMLIYTLLSRGTMFETLKSMIPMGPFVTAAYMLFLMKPIINL